MKKSPLIKEDKLYDILRESRLPNENYTREQYEADTKEIREFLKNNPIYNEGSFEDMTRTVSPAFVRMKYLKSGKNLKEQPEGLKLLLGLYSETHKFDF